MTEFLRLVLFSKNCAIFEKKLNLSNSKIICFEGMNTIIELHMIALKRSLLPNMHSKRDMECNFEVIELLFASWLQLKKVEIFSMLSTRYFKVIVLGLAVHSTCAIRPRFTQTP